MASAICAIVILSLVACIQAQAQAQGSTCADKLERTYECMEKLKTAPESQTLDKKKDAVLRKCVPDLPAQCLAIKKAADQCQEQVSKEPSLLAMRGGIKSNVSTCFDRHTSSGTWHSFHDSPMFPAFRRAPMPFAAFGGGPQQGPPLPPPPPSGGPFPESDPCAPTENQRRCIKNEMRTDNEAHDIAERLEEKQRDCFKELDIDDKCRVDGKPQLRECIEKAKEPFLQKALVKMQECMQASMNITMAPSLSNSQ